MSKTPEGLRELEVDVALREIGDPLVKSKALRDEVQELFCAHVDDFFPFDDNQHQGSPAAIYREYIVNTSHILNGCPKDMAQADAESQVRTFWNRVWKALRPTHPETGKRVPASGHHLVKQASARLSGKSVDADADDEDEEEEEEEEGSKKKPKKTKPPDKPADKNTPAGILSGSVIPPSFFGGGTPGTGIL